MARRFAQETAVSVERTRADIETTLSRYGAEEFAYRTAEGVAQIAFRLKNRLVRFTLPLPKRDDPEFTRTEVRRHRRSDDAAMKAWEQGCRQRWRALLLAIKAKLEAVDVGIAEFEEEFLAYVVDPGTGRTYGDLVRPQIEERYLSQTPGPLLLCGPGQV